MFLYIVPSVYKRPFFRHYSVWGLAVPPSTSSNVTSDVIWCGSSTFVLLFAPFHCIQTKLNFCLFNNNYSKLLCHSFFKFFFQHNFCVKPYVPREPRRDPSNRRLNGAGIYISDTARNRTHNLFRPKRKPIPLGNSDGQLIHVSNKCIQ